jgi:hypothetical protein
MQIFRRNRERDARDMSGVVADRASAAAERAQRLLEEGATEAGDALSSAQAQGAELAEAASETMQEWRSTVESAVRAQPIAALAFAALAGLAFGAMWRSGEK